MSNSKMIAYKERADNLSQKIRLTSLRGPIDVIEEMDKVESIIKLYEKALQCVPDFEQKESVISIEFEIRDRLQKMQAFRRILGKKMAQWNLGEAMTKNDHNSIDDELMTKSIRSDVKEQLHYWIRLVDQFDLRELLQIKRKLKNLR